MFRDNHPLAWTFHRNTSRWPHNLLAPVENVVPSAPFKEYLDAPLVALPEPAFPSTTLGDAIAARLACRRFTNAPLSLQDLGTLLRAAYGIGDGFLFGDSEFLERPVPSGGGLYPLELYLLVQRVADVEPGLYHYAPLAHGLERISDDPPPPPGFVSDLFLGQPYVAAAPVVLLLSAVVERSMIKYGDRGYRYILFEAGHVAQNVALTAAALGLGSLSLGGFFDTVAADLFGLDIEAEVPLYGLALGVPDGTDRSALRQP